MDWWHKIRRTWCALSTRIKLRKSGVGRHSGGIEYNGDVGLLKLRDDVQMCGYRDVEVMWNMLSITLHHDQVEATNSTTACNCRSISTALIINF
ncbi:hypothetical protein S83_037279 [Arachis hypogaea]|uniref:Uncharacterized protein n=1 Tax=Arachis hypogaea TaxID=3818 RepID=A0A445AUQ9_ARAHY|nr:uncharacterized protein DS421_11g351380 [Arachis hypogaea]RYR30168.1 hypothetical protein Ahy_B01g054997 [Arachis hypogaea]